MSYDPSDRDRAGLPRRDDRNGNMIWAWIAGIIAVLVLGWLLIEAFDWNRGTGPYDQAQPAGQRLEPAPGEDRVTPQDSHRSIPQDNQSNTVQPQNNP